MGDFARRDMFKLGGAAMLAACQSAGGGGHAGSASAPAADVEEKTLAQLAGIPSVQLLAKYKARIDAMNLKGPELRAVLELDPDAERAAAALDAERAAGKVRGPLHGIPVLLKDNLDTGGRMMTTAGSLALAGSSAKQDSAVAAKLRAAGALIFGKTNLSEWANIRGNPSTSGWSGRGGQCRNPYALDRTPSGSSSGSAAAVAANLCAVAIGSETDGSITSPASVCGLVGMKPTVGLVSQAGIIPISASQDTAGPMARTVTDCAVLLSAIVDTPADYTKFLSSKALAGARIGVPRKGWFGLLRTIDAVGEIAIEKLKRLGAEVVDVDLPIPGELGAAEFEVLMYELNAGMTAYLATRDTKLKSLADVVAWNKAHAAEELGIFGQETFEKAAAKGPLTEQAYKDARALCIKLARTEGIDKVMDASKLDAVFAMTGPPPWLIDPINGDAFVGPNTTTLPAVAGYPHITVPAGQYRGLPIGMSLFGRANSEGKLLGYAYAYEQATMHRRPPTYAATAAPA